MTKPEEQDASYSFP